MSYARGMLVAVTVALVGGTILPEAVAGQYAGRGAAAFASASAVARPFVPVWQEEERKACAPAKWGLVLGGGLGIVATATEWNDPGIGDYMMGALAFGLGGAILGVAWCSLTDPDWWF